MSTAATIRALWEDGVTPDEKIARRAGVSRQYVWKVLGAKEDRRVNVVAACREIREELERPITLTIQSPLYEAGAGTHGLAATYGHGCRCALCTNALRRYIGGYKLRRHNPTHGRSSTYTVYAPGRPRPRVQPRPLRRLGRRPSRRLIPIHTPAPPGHPESGHREEER